MLTYAVVKKKTKNAENLPENSGLFMIPKMPQPKKPSEEPTIVPKDSDLTIDNLEKLIKEKLTFQNETLKNDENAADSTQPPEQAKKKKNKRKKNKNANTNPTS